MIASPCVNLCRMDAASGLCQGCFRTLDEIARWTRIDDAERRAIIAAAAQRRDERGPQAGQMRGNGTR